MPVSARFMKYLIIEYLKKMVGLRGFEPPTSPTPRERATSLRHSPNDRGDVNKNAQQVNGAF